MKGYRLSDYNTTVYSNAWQPWTPEGKKTRPPKAQAVLTEVWEFLPQQAKELMETAAANGAAWFGGLELPARKVS